MRERYLEDTSLDEANYRKNKPQVLDALHMCRNFLAEFCHAPERATRSVAQIAQLYHTTSKVLREKRESLLLQQALNELGDLLVVMGRTKDAEATWRSSIDALFSTLDFEDHWQAHYSGLLQVSMV